MIKRVPTRNNRSKGVKVKTVLQICLLLGVCFWLIYQVKRSHDKKKETDENEVNGMINTDRIQKFGRKDLHPRVPVLTNNDKQDDDEDDEVGEVEVIRKEEDNKLDQEQEEAEMKHREEEEEEGLDGEPKLRAKEREEIAVNKEEERGQESKSEEVEEGPEEEDPEDDSKKEQMREDNDDAGDGDDDVDEHNQEKIEGEADHDEEPRDEEKEAQDGEEEEIDVAESEGQVNPDHETSVEDQDLDGGEHDLDGGDQIAHEAREEIYKADDASSAVTHDARALSTESENVNQDHSEKNTAMTGLVIMTDITSNGTDGVHGDRDQKNGQPLNMTPADDEKLLANSDDQSVRGNTTTSAEVNVQGGLLTSKGNNAVTNNISQHDGEEIDLESQSHDGTANGSSTGDSTQLNTTVLGQESNKTETDGAQQDPDKGPSSHLESDASRMNINHEVTADGEVDSGMSSADNTKDDTHSAVPVIASDNTQDATHSDEPVNSSDYTAGATLSGKPGNTTENTEDATPSVNPDKASDNTEDAAHSDNPKNTSESGDADENNRDSNADSKGDNEERHDPDHSSDPEIGQDEKESRLDLGTLPESSSDGVNDRNTAVE